MLPHVLSVFITKIEYFFSFPSCERCAISNICGWCYDGTPSCARGDAISPMDSNLQCIQVSIRNCLISLSKNLLIKWRFENCTFKSGDEVMPHAEILGYKAISKGTPYKLISPD
jgi:hypothetical protein